MKKFTLTVAFFGLLLFALAKPVNASSIVWSRTYGGAGHDHGEAVIQTSDGGYALAGGTRSFGPGDLEFWLVKTDSLGNMIWNKTYGHGIAASVVQTGDGGYALGGNDGEGAKLVKTNYEGNMQWNKTYGGGKEVKSMIQTSDGGYALAGFSDFDSAWTTDFWFIKTDALGNLQWNKTYGQYGQSDWASSVIQTSDGGYALLGVTTFGGGMTQWNLVKTDSAGNIEWSKGYGSQDKDEGNAVVQTSDGGYALGGWMWSRSNGGGPTIALVKTDSVGKIQWNRTYGGGIARSMIQTGDGGYALASLYIVKTDFEGNMQWNQTYGRYWSSPTSMIQTSDGGYALAGTSVVDDIHSDTDAWLVKTDSEGIIPEFPSWILLLIMLVAVMVVAIIYRRNIRKHDYGME